MLLFVKIWKSLPSFRGDAQFFTWLYRIATNVALNFLNKQKVRSALSFESLSDSLERKVDEDPWFNGNEVELELSKAIQKLPQKQKAVFCMRYYQELSYEEISEIMGFCDIIKAELSPAAKPEPAPESTSVPDNSKEAQKQEKQGFLSKLFSK